MIALELDRHLESEQYHGFPRWLKTLAAEEAVALAPLCDAPPHIFCRYEV
jgi:hypothetical protein